MLPRLSLILRLAFMALLVPAIVAAPMFTSIAIADDDDDDDEFYDDDEEEEDESQPPMTAGGMYTKQTYPTAELDRPLTITGGMLEVRGGLDIDVGAQTAFEIWYFKLSGRYGLQDNVELQAGADFLLTGERVAGMDLGTVYAGIAAGLVYDVVNVRLLFALPFTAGANPENIDVGFDIIAGVPFRYRIKPEFAIFALDKILTIHTKGGKPDLTVGVGGIYQITPEFAALLRGEITIPEFNTDNVIIPATAAAQFSPNNTLDIGGEFTFRNFRKIEQGQEDKESRPFDDRSLLLYARMRF